MSDPTPNELILREENEQLRAQLEGYEKRDTERPSEFAHRLEQVESKLDTVITSFESYAKIMDRVVAALQSEPRCADCPNRSPKLSVVPGE